MKNEKNYFVRIIKKMDSELFQSEKEDLKKSISLSHWHTTAPVLIISIYVVGGLLLHLFGLEKAKEWTIDYLPIVQVPCLAYLFGYLFYLLYKQIKAIPSKHALINRAKLEFNQAEKSLDVLSEFEKTQLQKLHDWLTYRIKKDYIIAAVFIGLYTLAHKLQSVLTANTKSSGSNDYEILFFVFGVSAIAFNLLANSFQKYLFHIKYSIDHGKHQEPND